MHNLIEPNGKKKRKNSVVSYVIITILTALGLFALNTLIACVLWNTIIVEIFSAPALTFWQTLGIQLTIMFFIPSSWTSSINSKD